MNASLRERIFWGLVWGVLALLGAYGAYEWVWVQGRVSPDVVRGLGVARDLLDGHARGREGLVLSLWRLPLPTLVKLGICKEGHPAFSYFLGHLFSGLLGLGTVMAVWSWAGTQGVRGWGRFLLVVCMSTEPGLVAASWAGRDVMLSICLFSWTLVHLARWVEKGATGSLVTLSILLALASLASPLAFFVMPLVILTVFCVTLKDQEPFWGKMEGSLILLLMPFLYATSLWLLLGWLIMGDPFFWLRGVIFPPLVNPVSLQIPSDLGQQADLLMKAGWQASPLFMLLAIPGLIRIRRLGVLALTGLCVGLWHWVRMQRGVEWGLKEDALLLVPLGYMLWVPWASSGSGRTRQILSGMAFAALLGVMGLRISQGGFGQPGGVQKVLDQQVSSLSEGQDSETAREEIGELSQRLKALCQSGWVWVTGVEGYDLRALRESPHMVHTMTLDMEKIMRETAGQPLYLVVPRPVGEKAFNPLNVQMPGVYEKGAPFLLFEEECPGWRIWKVVRTSANPWGVTPRLEFRDIGE